MDTIPVILKAGTFLWDLPAGADKHLVILCGAGSLSVNTEHTLGGTDGADFHDAFKPLAALRWRKYSGGLRTARFYGTLPKKGEFVCVFPPSSSAHC